MEYDRHNRTMYSVSEYWSSYWHAYIFSHVQTVHHTSSTTVWYETYLTSDSSLENHRQASAELRTADGQSYSRMTSTYLLFKFNYQVDYCLFFCNKSILSKKSH